MTRKLNTMGRKIGTESVDMFIDKTWVGEAWRSTLLVSVIQVPLPGAKRCSQNSGLETRSVIYELWSSHLTVLLGKVQTQSLTHLLRSRGEREFLRPN